MTTLEDTLLDTLKSDKRCVVEGQLNKAKIEELALELDPALLKAVLSNKKLKEHFFTEIDKITVFDKVKFQRFINNKSFLPDSYTSYKNKIGLTDADGNFLAESREIVLSFPHKDCILEGGQDKEDIKRDEIFFNEILAPDDIDYLLEPKVLTNFKKYDSKGEHDVSTLSYKDNLIIKGNNLLALHSLEKVYSGKVKLIYIDPPFNTGNDSFKYNDSFNHSSWLTFVKNRLEIAHKLLKEDGAIFVQIDDKEQAYLKVLLDEIFGRDNFCNQISVKTNSAFGYKGTSDSLFKQAGFILFYTKNKEQFVLNKTFVERDYDEAYKYVFDDISIPESKWTWKGIKDVTATSLGFETSKKAISEIGKSSFEAEVAKFALENAKRVFRTASVTGGAYLKRKETLEKSKNNKKSIIRHPNDDMDYIFIGGERVLFYKERLVDIDGLNVAGEILTDIWDDISIEGIANEGEVSFPKGKKPEKLLKKIIEIASSENDLILDFFMGSGTTHAVSHKMKRRWIGIEQMSYTENLSKKRLINVVNGEQTGISKDVEWKGGGSFVYCELAKSNQTFIDDIKNAKSDKDLEKIWNTIKDKGFLSYKIKASKFDLSSKEFKDLSLDDKKKFLVGVLDKNMLYVNFSEIDDKTYNISAEDKKLNKHFYTLEKQQQLLEE